MCSRQRTRDHLVVAKTMTSFDARALLESPLPWSQSGDAYAIFGEIARSSDRPVGARPGGPMEQVPSTSSDSFAPIELGDSSVDLDESTAELLGQRRSSLRIALLIGAMAVVGATAWMESIDTSSEYASAASSLQAIQVDGIDRFWSCAAPNTYPKANSEASLAGVIHAWSSRNPSIYAQYVQGCMPHLTASESQLATLALPNVLHREGLEVRNAVTAARLAWTQYFTFLSDPYQDYDTNTSRDHALWIARTKTRAEQAITTLKTALQAQ